MVPRRSKQCERSTSRPLAVLVALCLMASGCSDLRPGPIPDGEVDRGEQQGGDETAGRRTGEAGAASELGRPNGWTSDSPIRVDQFGYRPGDSKVAVLVDPQAGFNADADYNPAATIEVRTTDGEVVKRVRPIAWKDGDTHLQSGDRGWWLDFSDVDEPGSYYLVDVEAGFESATFDIGEDVYAEVLNTALRTFWFNRGNVAHPEEMAGPWSDTAAFVGPDQDTEARWVDDRSNPATALDLSGGWFDAGDTNKYVTFASEPVHLLLAAYQRHPDSFDDSLGIPESSNGLPDIIDEVRWEIDWLERMQSEDGGVLTKVGVVDLEDPKTPSRSDLPRYYEEACSSSTITAAGMFAHAAIVFGSFPELINDVERLRRRAEAAWDWYNRNPVRDDCDPQIVWAGDADLSVEDQAIEEVVAAIYLLGLTGQPPYEEVVTEGYEKTVPFTGDGFGHYGPDQADALLFYRDLPEADPRVSRAIDDRIATLVEQSPMFGLDPGADLYRSFIPDWSYHWGSNQVKANAGTANALIGVDADSRDRALGHLHYFHGVNPFGISYLSNMGDYGADYSVEQLFHYWFGDGSRYDVDNGSTIGVVPGYVVGGPNQFYTGSNSPPAGQPIQKSYLDWAANGSQPSWEITEPAIYYQAAYVRLLTEVIGTP